MGKKEKEFKNECTSGEDNTDELNPLTKNIIDSLTKVRKISVPIFKNQNRNGQNTIDVQYENKFSDLAGSLKQIMDKKELFDINEFKRFSSFKCGKFFDIITITKKILSKKNIKISNKGDIKKIFENYPKYIKDAILEKFDECWGSLMKKYNISDVGSFNNILKKLK